MTRSTLKEARFYQPRENEYVDCGLCPHNCHIKSGSRGICGVRINDQGVLRTEIYGMVTGIAMDPIEKKPLYHFFPGSKILSIGTRGCNMKCPYCQNWNISQDIEAPASFYTSREVVDIAEEKGSVGLAYTYSEPGIWFEYVRDTADLVRDRGMKNVMVTNGYINPEPLEELLPVIDAMNIDLKSFREETYRKINKAGLQEVCRTIRRAHEAHCHVEVTTLVVTGLNDSIEEMRDIIDFLSSISGDLPWHVSRYFPQYKYTKESTDIGFMMKVCEEAKKKLRYVYCGNIPDSGGENNTVCPSCGSLLIQRSGYFTRVPGLSGDACKKCKSKINIIN